MEFIKERKEMFSILCLCLFCGIMFFSFMGAYPLIDVDETRYVRIAQEMFESHNFLTPVINGELFLEKPPLYFWLEDLSFALFGTINEWTARIPMGIVATFGVFFTYFTGKKLISNRFGLISALVLGSSVMYIVLSHIAILDLLLSVTMMASVYCGILTLFSEGKENYIQWFGFYVFCALSVLAKGLPGLIIPFFVVFCAYFFSKKLNKLFDFKKIALGLILLLLIVLPWHLMMYKVHGQHFINEYIIKHHFARFLNSEGINRKECFLFYVPVLLVGFIHFITPLLSILINKLCTFVKNFKKGFNYNLYRYFSDDILMQEKFLNINIMAFCVIFLFFSVSSTKLPTYILPATFPMAFIVGYIFDKYIEEKQYEIQLKISSIIMSSIFGLVSVAALITVLFVKVEVIKEITPVLILGCILFGAFAIYNFVKLYKKQSQVHLLISSILFMIFLTVILNLKIFNMVVNFGQADLIKYATYAKDNDKKFATFDFGNRYSVIYYYGKHVDICGEQNFEWLNKKLDDNYVVVLKNKRMVAYPKDIKYTVIETGKKYSLVKKAD